MNELGWLVLVSLGSYRLWRFAAQDTAPFLRRPREALLRRLGPKSAMAEMLLCPFCLGAWITFGLVTLLAQMVSLAQPVLFALAASMLVGLIHNLDEN